MQLIGTQIGGYVVERELGSGGTGTVYLCRNTLIDRAVAVKVLHDDQAMDAEQVDRFFQEAKAAADIGHPHIITIIDFGQVPTERGSRSYLMMEALDGESLDKRLRRGGLSLDDVRHILEQICSALTASHGKGIIHRDLKPANIFLCKYSFDPLFVKLLDFGIAKLTAPGPAQRRTMFGMVLGTPAFMSPEQCEGRGAVDHRSDIYSLGIVLYQMLTGTLPFEGDVRDVMLAHLHEAPPPPRARNPALPPAWEALCLHMMEKAKTERFQSITEVAAALGDLDGHAAAYGGAVAARAASGHSGRTEKLPGVGAPLETLHVASGPIAIPPAAPPAPPSFAEACAAVAADPDFVAATLRRLEGRWVELVDPRLGAPVDVAWLEHPYREPSLVALVFAQLRTGQSAVVIARRP
jgi:eukaryotic-like serine/threonine-protein kinase